MLKMSITLAQAKCPNCGGPLTLPGACEYCDAEFSPGPGQAYRIPKPLPKPAVPHLGRLTLGSQNYLVHGRLAQGAHCDVYLARKDAPLTEMVILKVARGDDEALAREWKILNQLHQRPDFLTSLLPVPVHRAPGRATVYRWRSGFQFTLEDAKGQADPGSTVWMWNRLLEQLTVLHGRGYHHAALLPQHLLLHPRDHGLALCGWSHCQTGASGPDLADSGRCISSLLGWRAPKKLKDLAAHAGTFSSAGQLKLELKRVALEVFGPPRFRPLILTNGGNHGIR